MPASPTRLRKARGRRRLARSGSLNEAAARGERLRAQGSARSSRLRAMTNIHSNPTPLRQKFIEYLTLNRKAERTVHCYVSFIYSLAKHCRRSPDLLGPEDIRQWLYYLIAERKQAASTVNLAINAVRSFFGGLLQQFHLLAGQALPTLP